MIVAIHNKKGKVISKRGYLLLLKLIQSFPNMPNKITETEVNNFLERKLNIQLATIDEEGYPAIHPLWFLYDKESGKIYRAIQKMINKVRNLYRNQDNTYFSIDDKNFPYKEVKGG